MTNDTRNDGSDKRCHHVIKQVPLQPVAMADQIHSAQALQLDITANRGKNVIPYRHLATHLKMLNTAHRLDGPVIWLNLPVLVMQLEEGFAAKAGQRPAVRQVNRIMAPWVFQPRPQ